MEDYDGSAKRHFSDAISLAEIKSFDNAGYLIGLAVECAIKKKCRLTRGDIDKGNGHLPGLTHIAKLKIDSRRDTMLFNTLNRGVLKNWAIDARYAPTGNINEDLYKTWFNEAKVIFRLTGIKKDK
ncbi:hypothetical protein [Pantoea dispersa]|uniref:hypothetical protein n=1 Tax=Pantoea dispersa TaxID=59814 RepID=UPI0039B44AEE